MNTILFPKRSHVSLTLFVTALFSWLTFPMKNLDTKSSAFNRVASSIIMKIPIQLEINSTYYLLRPDIRKCAFPMCGGYFVSRVNRTTTRCIDGTDAGSCYVADIDWGKCPVVNINSEGSVILRGSIERKTFSNGMVLGSFHPTEVWQSAINPVDLSSNFYRATLVSSTCLVPPCPTHDQVGTLNSSLTRQVEAVDLSSVTTDKTFLSKATEAMKLQDGILVTGNLEGGTSSTYKLVAKNFYLRVKS